MKDITTIAVAIIGVAMVAVLVRGNSRTAEVITAAAGGFSTALGTAMGAGSGSGVYGGY